SFVADHFQYLASVGLIVLAAAGVSRVLSNKSFFRAVLCGMVLLILTTLTWRQCRMYSNLEKLWRVTIAKNPDSFLAHNNLGLIFFRSGRTDDAIAQYDEALRINPNSSEAHNNLGQAILQKGDVDGAIREFKRTLEIAPKFVDANVNIGAALIQKGEADKAISYFQKVLEIKPKNLAAENNLGNAFMQ